MWLYGVRNAWRFSFDRATGDLWIGDVGEKGQEEISVLYADRARGKGSNLGWPVFEGNAPFRGERPPSTYSPPVFTYGRREGCAIIGGFVYRGRAIPALRGAYLFTDFCQGLLRAIVVDANDVIHHPLGVDIDRPSSFGEGADGELYVLSLKGDIYRIDPA